MADESATRGCLKAAVSFPVLIVLAPLAALVRTFTRWRRGVAPQVDRKWTRRQLKNGRKMACLHATVDLTLDGDGPRVLTGVVARLAESLKVGKSVYHLVHDEPGGDGDVAVPLGPSIQALAERFYLISRRSTLDGLPVMWLALPQSISLGVALEDTAGNTDTVARLLRLPLLWGMVIVRRLGNASIQYSIDLVVPVESKAAVDSALDTLRDQEPT